MLKQVVTEQKMMPIMESVNVPFFMNYINDQDVFVPDDGIQKSTDLMLSELAKWTTALKPMREK